MSITKFINLLNNYKFSVDQELKEEIAIHIPTKDNFKTQGAQKSVTSEKAIDVNLIAALNTSSLTIELMYKAIAAIAKVTNDRASI